MDITNTMKCKTIEQTTPWISLEAIYPFLPHNPVIIEAGAHTGKDTLKLKNYWPESIIHAFEPVPSLYKQLIHQTQKASNIFCYQIALSDHVGTAQMYISSGKTDACSSLLAPSSILTENRPDVFFKETLTVPTTTLNTWTQEHHSNFVDFLWLDLQGAELKVLRKATDILANVKVIHTEINETTRYVGSALYDELRDFLEAQSFYAHIKALSAHKWGNALFVRYS